MAHRLLVQIVFTGAKVFGRAFTEAYRQAAAATTAQQAASGGSARAKRSTRDQQISLDESCKILDLQKTNVTLENAQKRFDYLFDVNSKEKGGSFYVQSKVFRAMERIKDELEFQKEAAKETGSADAGPASGDPRR